MLTTKFCLNPATFLWKGEKKGENIEHNCLDLIEHQTTVRSDLQDTPLGEGKLLFINKFSRAVHGKRCTGLCCNGWGRGAGKTDGPAA